jgi:hypothetical protein
MAIRLLTPALLRLPSASRCCLVLVSISLLGYRRGTSGDRTFRFYYVGAGSEVLSNINDNLGKPFRFYYVGAGSEVLSNINDNLGKPFRFYYVGAGSEVLSNINDNLG